MLGIPHSLHGAARREDAVAVLGDRSVRAALRDGLLVQPWRGVLVDGRRALETATRASAALLACGQGAVLSGPTALRIHGCDVSEDMDVHVTVPYLNWVRSKAGLIIHHDQFDQQDVVCRDRLPVFVLDHAIAEVLCSTKRWVGLACLDKTLSGRSDADARSFLAAVGSRLATRDNRRGLRVAESLLCLGTSGAESPQESRLRLLVIDAGYPLPVTQHAILTLSGELLYRLDMAWVELRIGVEYDGYEAHEGREEYDVERDRRLAGRGWRIIRVRKDVFADPSSFLGELRQAFAARGVRVA